MAVNELCRARGIYHISDEAYEYFVYDGARHFSPGSVPAPRSIPSRSSRCRRPTASRLAHRLHDRTRAVADGDQEDAGHDPDLSAGRFAGSCLRMSDGGAGLLPPSDCRIGAGPPSVLDELAEVADCCQVAHTQGAFYFLVRVTTQLTALEMVERLIREFGVGVCRAARSASSKAARYGWPTPRWTPRPFATALGRLARGIRRLASGAIIFSAKHSRHRGSVGHVEHQPILP